MKAMLEALCENTNDLQTLVAIQRALFKEITRAETHIARLKNEIIANVKARKSGRNEKAVVEQLRQEEKILRSRIEKYRDIVYLWRLFGDAILFCYTDRFALKHAYYNTSDYNPKQDAGFLSGKDGRQQEVLLLEAAIASDVPAVLCDLTNIARYGDVCLLGAPDPYFIEVKSRPRVNKRGAKQLADIETLHNFYTNDIVEKFRGAPLIRRVAYSGNEISHVEALNECIDQTTTTSSSIAQPEPSLYYASTYINTEDGINGLLLYIINQAKIQHPMIFPWNAIKDNKR